VLGKLDVAVGCAATAVFPFQYFQERLHVRGRRFRLLVVVVGPCLDIVTLRLKAPETRLLDDSDLSFDAILIPDSPFVAASHKK